MKLYGVEAMQLLPTDSSLYNVAYDDSHGNTKHYCVDAMSYPIAEKYRDLFIDRYQNKPYPNGKGYYDVHNVRIISIE